MAMVITDDRHYANIACVIRLKLGTDSTFTPSQMASAIRGLTTGDADPIGLIDAIATDNIGSVLSGALVGSSPSIPGNTFHDCQNVTEIDFQGCTYVGDEAFARCTSLSSASLPLCSVVGSGAFVGCTSIESLDLPSCTSVMPGAFSGCVSLSSVGLPACESVGSSAFAGCVELARADLASCAVVHDYAFSGCSSLSRANLPLCSKVGAYAFSGCTSLAAANVGACVLLGTGAFYGCGALSSLYLLNGAVVPSVSSNALSGTPIVDSQSSGTVYVLSDMLQAFLDSPQWASLSSRITSITLEEALALEV